MDKMKNVGAKDFTVKPHTLRIYNPSSNPVTQTFQDEKALKKAMAFYKNHKIKCEILKSRKGM
jgi:hypothetical protein